MNYPNPTHERFVELTKMIAQQRDLQEESFGYSFNEMLVRDRVEYVKMNVMAIEHELHELLDETSWKPWADAEYLNEDAAFKELIDAWHFLMNIMIALSPNQSAFDIAERLVGTYGEKREINAKRQVEGYDGVSTKCPDCKRALDEPSSITVTRTPATGFLTGAWCALCGYHLDLDLAQSIILSRSS